MMHPMEARLCLLQVALSSIESGLRSGTPSAINSEGYTQALRDPGACFVTLKINQSLRGCIGSLEARRPLVDDVAINAFAAAFRDPRFQKLGHEELDLLNIGISILGPSKPLVFDSERALLDLLRPGQDGLILQDGNARGTFLPAVWESIPGPAEFFNQLKVKAGLTADYWSETLKVWRYTTESFNAPASEIRNSNESTINTG